MKIIILMSVLLFAGCTTLKDAKVAKGTGVSKVYEHSYDKVWDIAVVVVNESRLDLVSENKSNGEILAQKGISAFSYGENVVVFINKVEPSKTNVEVVFKRALSTNVLAKNWASYIHEKMKKALK